MEIDGEEEEPEEESTLGSRLMSLLEKVKLVKKTEEKPEEEPAPEEHKPREDWGPGRVRAGQALCSRTGKLELGEMTVLGEVA